MKITLEHDDFVTAVEHYVNNRFGIDVGKIELSGTKGNMSAIIDIPSNIQVTLGPAKLDVLPGRAKEDLGAFAPTTKDEPKAIASVETVASAPVVETEPAVEVQTETPSPFATPAETASVEAPNLFGTAETAPVAAPVVLEEAPVEVTTAPLGDNLFATTPAS